MAVSGCGLVCHNVVVELYSSLMNYCCFIKVNFCVSKETQEKSPAHRQFSVVTERGTLIQFFKMHETSRHFKTCLFFHTYSANSCTMLDTVIKDLSSK